jgi:transcriptional regulator with XRE-family HTH domain
MVGRRIRLLRERQGRSRTALARAAGVTLPTLDRLEGGAGRVALSKLWRVADVLSVHITDLVAEPGRSRLDGEQGESS